MARTVIAVQEVPKNSGAELVDVAADQANGMLFINDGATELIVQNGDGSPRDVIITAPACSHGRTLVLTKTIAAGKRGILGAFDPASFNQASGADQGKLYVDFSAGTPATVKVHARRITG